MIAALVYMLLARPYTRSTAPAGDAVRLKVVA